MGFSNIGDALSAYNAALPWQQSRSAAQTCLDAIRYLLLFRAQHLSDAGMQFSYETLLAEKKALERFLGATAPRAFGRSRRNTASFQTGGIG